MKTAIFLPLLFMLFSCKYYNEKRALQKQVDSLETEISNFENTGYLTQAILWYQLAPETQALYLQEFNTAGMALEKNLDRFSNSPKKNAIIVDIDETILNNGLYQGWLLANNQSFTDETWTRWVKDTLAVPLPGAVDFLKYAEKLNCEIFYVSNRKHDKHFEATLQNLQKYNLPFADAQHLFLKTVSDTTKEGRSSKTNRRQEIQRNHNILLFIGDQLADFDNAFDVYSNSSFKQINDSVNKYRDDFGNRFIVLPNPIYCDWLGHIVYGADARKLSVKQLDSLRRIHVQKWKP